MMLLILWIWSKCPVVCQYFECYQLSDFVSSQCAHLRSICSSFSCKSRSAYVRISLERFLLKVDAIFPVGLLLLPFSLVLGLDQAKYSVVCSVDM